MAVIEGKRYPGILFYKVRGRREWLAVDHNLAASYWAGGTLLAQAVASFVEVNTVDPDRGALTLTGVSQEYLSETCTPSSWRKLPEGWRRALGQRIRYGDPAQGDTWFLGGW